MRKKRTKPQGSSRMRELGYKPVQLWLDEALYDRLGELARSECTTVARMLKAMIDDWAFSRRYMTTAELAEAAKRELR